MALQVASIAFRNLLDLGANGGVKAADLVRDFPFSESELRNPIKRFPWPQYVSLMERLRDCLGGPAALTHECENFVSVVPDVALIAAAFVSPAALCRFIFHVLDPIVFPMVKFSTEVLPDGRFLFTNELAAGYDDALVWFRDANIGAVRSMPKYLGMGLAEVEAEAGPRFGRYTVRFPESRTALARAQRFGTKLVRDALLDQMQHHQQELVTSLEHAERMALDLDRRNAELQREVRARRELETALTRTLRTLQAPAYLVTAGGLEPLNEAAQSAVRLQGAEAVRAALEDGAAGSEVEQASLSGARLVIGSGFDIALDARVAVAKSRWSLTARQAEVLRCLAEGLSSKEIGARLQCSYRTVDIHVLALLEKVDALSRLELLARFWSASA